MEKFEKKEKKVAPSPQNQGHVQGHPGFVLSQRGDFGISTFYSAISLPPSLPLAIGNSETLGWPSN